MREYFSFRRYCSGKKEKFAKPSFFWYDEKENVQNSIQNKIFVEIEKTLRGFIMERIEKKELKKLIRENVKTLYRKTLENASPEELYQAAVFAVRDVITDKWMKTHDEYYERDAKVVYYLSMEFLMGRFFGNALINLEMFDEVKEVSAELGIDYNMVEEAEPDPGLGNGGLGRLAACFLESLSTLSLPAYGCGIRYHYGIFEQRIENGYQVEVPDNWLENGDPWGIKRNEYAVEVKFGGNVRAVEKGNGEYRFVQENYQSVTAIPYDYPVIGYGNNTVNTLRLWEAKPKTRLDLKSFNEGNYQKAAEEELLANTLTDVLYPADEHIQGKELRLRQQYFFSATDEGDEPAVPTGSGAYLRSCDGDDGTDPDHQSPRSGRRRDPENDRLSGACGRKWLSSGCGPEPVWRDRLGDFPGFPVGVLRIYFLSGNPGKSDHRRCGAVSELLHNHYYSADQYHEPGADHG